jgi:hypothetical protein
MFLNPTVIQLKKLELGITIDLIDRKSLETKFFTIAAVMDKPAKAAFLNMVNSTGFYGCTKCLQPGVSRKVVDKEGDETGGIQHIYPFDETDPTGPKRTHTNYLDDLSKVIKSTEPVRGVKGPCCLSSLKYFYPVTSFCIDFMHSLLEGVIKKLFSFWFDSPYSKKDFCLRKWQQEIEKRLAVICPPTFVPSTPRTVYQHNLWRAHEYLSFILYYALPVFRDILPFDYYENLKKLVLFVETILAPAINIDQLNSVNEIIIEFVKEASNLYPADVMLSGMHELLHLVDSTHDFGPLNVINCFQFEELNRKLMRFIHGHDLIGEELIKIASTTQILSMFSKDIKNLQLQQYITTRLNFKSSNTKKLNAKLSQIKLLDKVKLLTEPLYISALEKYFGFTIENINVCQKIKFNGIKFSSSKILTKRCDSCFISIKNEIGLIDYFLVDENKIFCLSRKVVPICNSIYLKNYPNTKSNLFVSYISDEIFVEEIINIRKIVLINISDQNCFFSLFNSSHLFS